MIFCQFYQIRSWFSFIKLDLWSRCRSFFTPIFWLENFSSYNFSAIVYWSETFLRWFDGEWNGNVTLAVSHLLRTLYPTIIILFNINFTPTIPSNQTYPVRGRTNIRFSFLKSAIFKILLLKRIYGYYSVVNCADLSAHMQIFKIFFLLLFMKKQKQFESIILYERVWEIFLEISLYFFQKLGTLSLYFCKLYKFMKICYNRFQHLSEFHQIIKHFSNFLKSLSLSTLARLTFSQTLFPQIDPDSGATNSNTVKHFPFGPFQMSRTSKPGYAIRNNNCEQCCQPCGFIHTCADFKDFFLRLFMKKQKLKIIKLIIKI